MTFGLITCYIKKLTKINNFKVEVEIMTTINCTTDVNDTCLLNPVSTVFALEFNNEHHEYTNDDKRDFDLSVETAEILIAELQAWLITQK